MSLTLATLIPGLLLLVFVADPDATSGNLATGIRELRARGLSAI